MRGLKAKKIRRQIYGDISLKQRRYAIDRKTGEVFCVGRRADYKQAKKALR